MPQSALIEAATPAGDLISFVKAAKAPRKPTPGPTPFKNLPNELVLHIAFFLPYRVDLANFRRTLSREVDELVAPLMYQKIGIVLEPLIRDSLQNLFTTNNVGLKLIRELDVHLGVQIDGFYRHGGANPPDVWLEKALDALPANQLTRFKLHCHHTVSLKLQEKLWLTQNNLQTLEIFPSDSTNRGVSFQPQVPSIDLAAIINRGHFQNLRAIRLIPDTPADVSLAHAVLQSKGVKELEVDGRHWDSEQDFAPTANPDGTMKDELTGNLFSNVPRVSPSLPGHFDQLTKLCLKDIDLTLSKHTWLTYVNLQRLTHLELHYCKGADIFLMHVFNTAHSPKLLSFTLVHDLDARSDRTIHAVNELLRSTRDSIHTLILSLRNAHELPDVTLIGSESLHFLSFDISHFPDQRSDREHMSQTPKQLVYSREDFDVLVASCEKLTQLAIAFPTISFNYRKLEKKYPAYAAYLGRLAHSLNLTTLNITNLPPSYHTDLNVGQLSAQDASLERLATDIFEIFSFENFRDAGSIIDTTWNHSLEVLAFGVRDRDQRNPEPRYYCFADRTFFARPSKTSYATEKMYLAELRQEAMDINILDYEKRDFGKLSRQRFKDVEYDDELEEEAQGYEYEDEPDDDA